MPGQYAVHDSDLRPKKSVTSGMTRSLSRPTWKARIFQHDHRGVREAGDVSMLRCVLRGAMHPCSHTPFLPTTRFSRLQGIIAPTGFLWVWRSLDGEHGEGGRMGGECAEANACEVNAEVSNTRIVEHTDRRTHGRRCVWARLPLNGVVAVRAELRWMEPVRATSLQGPARPIHPSSLILHPSLKSRHRPATVSHRSRPVSVNEAATDSHP